MDIILEVGRISWPLLWFFVEALWFWAGDRSTLMAHEYRGLRLFILMTLFVVAIAIAARSDRELERQVEAQSQALTAARVAGRENEQLSIIAFDASSLPRRYNSNSWFSYTVNQLKRILHECSIDDRWYWTSASTFKVTTLYYQEDRAEDAAHQIAGLLPGAQRVLPISLAHINVQGIHADRDVIMFLGEDVGRVGRALSRDANTYRCPTLE